MHRNGRLHRGRTMPIEKLGATPDYDEEAVSSFIINPDNAFSGKSYLGLIEDDDKWLGVIPIDKGWWRRYQGILIDSDGEGGISLRLPIGVFGTSWLREQTSEASQFSTHNHDPELSPTLGRRAWGLLLSDAGLSPKIANKKKGAYDNDFFTARMQYGAIPLNNYKDYILDWDDGSVTYPRVFLNKEQAAKIKASPNKELLGDVQQILLLRQREG